MGHRSDGLAQSPFQRWSIGYFSSHTKDSSRVSGLESRTRVHKLLAVLGPSLASGALLCLAGCGDSARNVAAYHPPALQAATVQQLNPTAKAQSSTTAKVAPKIGVLPLLPSRGRTTFLALMSP